MQCYFSRYLLDGHLVELPVVWSFLLTLLMLQLCLLLQQHNIHHLNNCLSFESTQDPIYVLNYSSAF